MLGMLCENESHDSVESRDVFDPVPFQQLFSSYYRDHITSTRAHMNNRVYL